VTAGAASAQVAVQLVRTGTGSGAVNVHYATANGTALAGTDYTASSGSLSWNASDSASKSVSIPLLPGATAGRSFTLQLSSATGGTLAQPSAAIVSLVATGAGLKIISRGVPAFASSGTASQGNDANYSHTWRSSGAPATLAYDLSGVSPAPSAVLLAWYNDNSYGYDHALVGGAGYNNAGSYTIEVNAAAGGGSAPTSGWQVAAKVTGNTLHSRQHYLQFAGYHWIRINATAADGSSGNMDISIKMDVYDASNGVGDGWFFGGDSITANCMGHGSEGGSAYDSFGNEVAASKGIVPPQENAGVPGWTAQTYGQHIAAWLAATPSKYVTLSLGTNDAAGGLAPATFYTRMETLVKAVIAAGKVPVVPTIIWSPEPTHSANLPALNAQIQALYASYPQVVRGPDLYAYFQAYPNYISSDNIHPTAAGCAAFRSQWAQFAASTIY
jgi:lysophospholipase L1-like esterase